MDIMTTLRVIGVPYETLCRIEQFKTPRGAWEFGLGVDRMCDVVVSIVHYRDDDAEKCEIKQNIGNIRREWWDMPNKGHGWDYVATEATYEQRIRDLFPWSRLEALAQQSFDMLSSRRQEH